METVHFEQLISVGCGIDVHKDVIVATIRRSSKDYQTKSFTAFTSSLKDLSDWCKSEGVTISLWKAQEFIGNPYLMFLKKILK